MRNDEDPTVCKLGATFVCPQGSGFRRDCFACRQCKEHIAHLTNALEEAQQEIACLNAQLREVKSMGRSSPSPRCRSSWRCSMGRGPDRDA